MSEKSDTETTSDEKRPMTDSGSGSGASALSEKLATMNREALESHRLMGSKLDAIYKDVQIIIRDRAKCAAALNETRKCLTAMSGWNKECVRISDILKAVGK